MEPPLRPLISNIVRLYMLCTLEFRYVVEADSDSVSVSVLVCGLI